jgi:hypothetical protein
VGKIVLLAVAAAWAAVLLPPLLRSRLENRPGSSVTDFRRQLTQLQRTVPTRTMVPMRTMTRPLAPSPLSKPAVTGRPGQPHRTHIGFPQPATLERDATGETPRRAHRVHHDTGGRTHAHHRQMHVQRISRREQIRRRRANVLFVLVMANVVSLFLAATTKSQSMVYAFALAFVSLCGYCYKLAQIRQYEQDSRYSEANWFHAA